MKTKFIISTVGLVLLSSCAKTDLYDAEEAQNAASQANAEKVFGQKLDPNQDWCTTIKGQVTVLANASVKEVRLMVETVEAFEDPENPSVTTRTALKTINQAETKGRTSMTFYYDAPEANNGLYVAYLTNDGGYYITKVENGVASMDRAKTRGEGETNSSVLNSGYELPEANVYVAGSTTSFAGQEPQNWYPGEKFYYLNDYSALNPKTTPADYSIDFKKYFKLHIDTYLPNGRQNDNSYKVKNNDEYNNGIYVNSVEGEPIILTPVYKYDHATEYGNEVFNSDLYYYYYKESEVKGDFAKFIQSLPKYKAIPFDQVFEENEDAEVKRHQSYCLPFFETESSTTVADANTPFKFKWPKDYKIGFIIQAKTTADQGKKQGEIYGDGRMNNKINSWGNFKSSKLGKPLTDYPRILWITFNNKVFMTWESGTDKDFNDVVIQMEGGYVIPNIPDPDLEWFTYCFEDTQEGDYDMNDVVIKATRLNETTVEYHIVACGAHDEIYIQDLNCGVITDEAEVHGLFGADSKTFINTDGSDYEHVVAYKTVDEDFSFIDAETQPWIKDKTTGAEIHLAGIGQSPHGILIPTDFKYPKEKTPIYEAYPKFVDWGIKGDNNAILWYSEPVVSKVR